MMLVMMLMPAYVLFKNKEIYIIYAIDYSKVLGRQVRVEGLGSKVFQLFPVHGQHTKHSNKKTHTKETTEILTQHETNTIGGSRITAPLTSPQFRRVFIRQFATYKN
jgi:hypothetical protein